MLIGIFGTMGSGKTLIMSILSNWLSLQTGCELYANYELKDSRPVKSLKDLWSIERGVVTLDEFWVSMDSRQSEYNVNLSRWVNQTRKKNLLVLYTTQAMSQVDKRVRNANHLLIFCEHFSKSRPSYFRYTFITGDTGRILKSFKITDSSASNFFYFYDTFALVFPFYGGGGHQRYNGSNKTSQFRQGSYT